MHAIQFRVSFIRLLFKIHIKNILGLFFRSTTKNNLGARNAKLIQEDPLERFNMILAFLHKKEIGILYRY